MTALEVGGLVLAVEFALVACAVLFWMLHRSHETLKQDHAEAGAVLDKVVTSEDSRREALSGIFSSTYNLEGEELESTVNEYLEREKAFYSAMLNIYLERKGDKLHDMPKELTKVLAPLVHLTPQNMVSADELGSLESEKAELSAELQETKTTLGQLMDEYNAAFGRAQMMQEASEAASPSALEPQADIDMNPEAEPPAAAEPEPAEPEAASPEAAPSSADAGFVVEEADDEIDIDALLAQAAAPPPDADQPPPQERDDAKNRDQSQSFELDEEFEVDLDASGKGAEASAETEADDDWDARLDELSDLFETPPEANNKKPG
ncbi:MAG: hypothetical protein JXM75_07315 [Chromatiaceae bacterium]|nr:hypothetical protein [Chromatiaceae bacterium]